jgi:hypothetical protein
VEATTTPLIAATSTRSDAFWARFSRHIDDEVEDAMSHVRCRCGFVYPLLDGMGLCPRCVSLRPPVAREQTDGPPSSDPGEPRASHRADTDVDTVT